MEMKRELNQPGSDPDHTNEFISEAQVPAKMKLESFPGKRNSKSRIDFVGPEIVAVAPPDRYVQILAYSRTSQICEV